MDNIWKLELNLQVPTLVSLPVPEHLLDTIYRLVPSVAEPLTKDKTSTTVSGRIRYVFRNRARNDNRQTIGMIRAESPNYIESAYHGWVIQFSAVF